MASDLESSITSFKNNLCSYNARSFDLLMNNLTKKQKESFIEYRYFIVKGNYTGNLYRINCMRGSKIVRINKFKYYVFGIISYKRSPRYCVEAMPIINVNRNGYSNIPRYDLFLAQKLIIECDEREFFKIAKVTPSYFY